MPYYINGHKPTSDKQALTVECPLCKAKPNDPCTYVLPGNAPAYAYSPESQARLAKVGQPTKRCHNMRRNRYDTLRIRRVRAAQLAAIEYSASRHEAAKAERRWDYEEYVKLYTWLRDHGRLLTQIPLQFD